MLYTVIPLERIYTCRTESMLILSKETEKNEDTTVQYKNIPLRYGNVYARKTGDGYVVEKIHSTDMSDYLNEGYMPGTSIRPDK